MAVDLRLPLLHARFKPPDSYRPQGPYKLLPCRFTPLDDKRYVLTNLSGEYAIVTRPQLESFVRRELPQDGALFDTLSARHFVTVSNSESALDLLATKFRTRHANLAAFTGLHIFVVTLRCDHSCPYCQVSRVSSDKSAFDMSIETANRAIDLMFQSPNPHLKVEYQGGESLLNFELVHHITNEVNRRNALHKRDIQFVLATNLSPLTDEILTFCREHSILISTSLDGPASLHNANRPRPGNDSYQRAVIGIERCRASLGPDRVSALMTTTLRSLAQPEAIIDEYVAHGFSSIFLRWLSPFGFAQRTQGAIGYPVAEWNQFYEKGLRYILELNRQGIAIRESYASIVLRKMLTPFATSYVDLQSPAALGIGVVVYNYDGDVYASDEGRMLAEMGDHTFRLGNLHRDGYKELFASDRLLEVLGESMTDAIPGCVDCAFEPWCGTDPAFHQATQGDFVGHRPTSGFCARNMFVFKLMLSILEDEPDARAILESWAC